MSWWRENFDHLERTVCFSWMDHCVAAWWGLEEITEMLAAVTNAHTSTGVISMQSKDLYVQSSTYHWANPRCLGLQLEKKEQDKQAYLAYLHQLKNCILNPRLAQHNEGGAKKSLNSAPQKYYPTIYPLTPNKTFPAHKNHRAPSWQHSHMLGAWKEPINGHWWRDAVLRMPQYATQC